MATVTGLTAERMLEIEAASIIDGKVVDGELILTKHDGTEINAGPVEGPPGPQGPSGLNALPGEVKLWPGDILPDPETYGRWVWADGAWYPIADHPIAAAHISDAWRTFAGASDPGEDNFRVPDLRGLVPAGMDAMPDGSRANRMTRADAIILAKKTGKETHPITSAEMPNHSHGGVTNDSVHRHNFAGSVAHAPWTAGWSGALMGYLMIDGVAEKAVHQLGQTADNTHQHGIPAEGGNQAHENVQPTVMVPYIVSLDE